MSDVIETTIKYFGYIVSRKIKPNQVIHVEDPKVLKSSGIVTQDRVIIDDVRGFVDPDHGRKLGLFRQPFYHHPKLYGVCYTGRNYASDELSEAELIHIRHKVVDIDDFTQSTADLIGVCFQHDVEAEATLQINTTPALPIYYKGQVLRADVLKSGDVGIFSYCKDRYELISIRRSENVATYVPDKGLYTNYLIFDGKFKLSDVNRFKIYPEPSIYLHDDDIILLYIDEEELQPLVVDYYSDFDKDEGYFISRKLDGSELQYHVRGDKRNSVIVVLGRFPLSQLSPGIHHMNIRIMTKNDTYSGLYWEGYPIPRVSISRDVYWTGETQGTFWEDITD